MTSSPGRRLLTIAVQDEDDAPFSKAIAAQAESVKAWLTDPALADRRMGSATPQDIVAPTRSDLDRACDELQTAEDDDVVAVYVTGHGSSGASGRHFLHLAGTDTSRLTATAFETARLIEATLNSQAEHVLIMVDSCHAGALLDQINTILKDHDLKGREVSVISSADFDEKPLVGTFTTALSYALQTFKTDKERTPQEYLSPAQLSEALQRYCAEHPDVFPLVWPGRAPPGVRPHRAMPNPGFQPQRAVVAAAVEQLAPSRNELDQYWLSRGSGRTADDDLGWYFTGRHELMVALVSFLRHGEGLQVVTGVAGSGKSAVISRAVLLSDPTFRAEHPHVIEEIDPTTCPDESSIDAAVYARNKSSRSIAAELLAALGEARESEENVFVRLRDAAARLERERSVTLVVDGLDEASDPVSVITDVIAPLLVAGDEGPDREREWPGLRVVVGVRGTEQGSGPGDTPPHDSEELLIDLLMRTDPDCQILRTDGSDAATEVEAYVRLLLSEQRDANPYVYRPDDVAQAAELIASVVAPSFLEARLAAEQLRSAAQVQDVEDPSWRARLAEGVVGLFRTELHEVARVQSLPVTSLLAVLRASALAFGEGIPWSSVWPVAARAVHGTALGADPDELIRTVLAGRLSGYLVQSTDQGRFTYRPAHERVREVLRDSPAELLMHWNTQP